VSATPIFTRMPAELNVEPVGPQVYVGLSVTKNVSVMLSASAIASSTWGRETWAGPPLMAAG
jgi:hypothetical protein